MKYMSVFILLLQGIYIPTSEEHLFLGIVNNIRYENEYDGDSTKEMF